MLRTVGRIAGTLPASILPTSKISSLDSVVCDILQCVPIIEPIAFAPTYAPNEPLYREQVPSREAEKPDGGGCTQSHYCLFSSPGKDCRGVLRFTNQIVTDLFSSSGLPDLRPPENDLSPLAPALDCDTMLMFLSELEPGVGGAVGGVGDATPLPPPLAPLQPPTLECMTPNENELDNPLLMEFMNLDKLLDGSDLAYRDDVMLPETAASHDQDCFFSLSSPPLPSSSSINHSTFDFTSSAGSPASGDEFGGAEELPSPLVLSNVIHDHSYAAGDTATLGVDSPGSPTLERLAGTDEAVPSCSKKAKTSEALTKSERYLNRRRKNNVASQVSRAKRRGRVASLFSRENELVEANARLRQQVEEMTAEVDYLKRQLVERLAH